MGYQPVSGELSRRISAASFVCACLIVFLHSYTTGIVNGVNPPVLTLNTFVQEFVSQGVCRVAVPFFFFTSGMLLFRDYEASWEWTARKWRARVRSLLVPYLLWCLVGAVLWYSLSIAHALAFHRPMAEAGFFPQRLNWWNSMLGVTCFPPKMYHLWFLKVLLVCVLLAPVVGSLVIRVGAWIPIAGLGVFFCPYVPHVVATSLCFFSAGAYVAICRAPEELMRWGVGREVALAVAWFGLCVCKAILILSGRSPVWVFYVGQFAILVGLAALWLLVEQMSRLSSRLFGFSFFIYCLHFPLFNYLGAILKRIALGPLEYWFLVPLVNICLCLLVGAGLQRWLPKTYSVLTGGR